MPASPLPRAPVSGDPGEQRRPLSAIRTLVSTARPRLRQEHRISIAEKPISRAHCMLVSREHGILTGECAHEHEQCGLREMEVGEQRIDDLEIEARTDEQAGFAGPSGCRQMAQRRQSCRLQRTHDRCAYRHTPPAFCSRPFYSFARCRTHRDALGVHDVRLQIVGSHWLKRPRTHMQCYEGAVHPECLYLSNELRIKVQASCRRSHCTAFTRKDALITFAVIGIGRTVNVRWKRYIAPLLEEFQRRPGQ